MALVNHKTKEVQFKIVYCGPEFAGKTTNLQHIHARIDDQWRGDLVSMATSTDRAVFFDYLPIDAVLIKGWHTKFQLYTVPGRVAAEASRQLILRGADGIVFVVDSSRYLVETSDCWMATREALRLSGQDPDTIPWVTQFNKRDHPDAVNVLDAFRVLKVDLPPVQLKDRPYIEAVASQGFNVFATLNVVAEEALNRFHASLERNPAA